jgi:rare lipoprotein A (peptidoglycan hydrolase)
MTPFVAVALAANMALASLTPTTATTTGTASWYDWHPRQAAAGPRLRALLGRDWRGSVVRVCVGTRCLPVRLTDWCQCYKGTIRERVIDLDDRAFAALAPLSRGLVKVKVVFP